MRTSLSASAVAVLSIFTVACSSTPAREMLLSCSADREQCITASFLLYADEHPENVKALFEETVDLLKKRDISDDPRIFSPIVHAIGMQLAQQSISPTDAFQWCGTSFKQGCMHGFMMEHIELHHDDVQVEQLFSLCDFALNEHVSYRNCVHAVGHEIAAKMRGDLSALLEFCDDRAMSQDCASGVMMEYSTGEYGTGGHSHMPAGTRRLPCGELQHHYQATCFAADVAYRLYLPGRESFDVTADHCMAVPIEFRRACMLGVAEKIFTVSAENINVAHERCGSLSSIATATECSFAMREIVQLESVL